MGHGVVAVEPESQAKFAGQGRAQDKCENGLFSNLPSGGPFHEQIDVNFGQPSDLPKGELIWPIADHQRPEVVHSVEAFLETLLFQPHLDRVIVLPRGVELLRQQCAIPKALRDAALASRSVRGLVDAMSEEAKSSFKARLWHYSKCGHEAEVRDGGSKRTLSQVVEGLRKREAEGSVSKEAPLYVSELRWKQKVEHSLEKNTLVKTATTVDIYDVARYSRQMPLWERSEGGIFIGERGAGSGMHVDQCLWSNVGRNWCGYKLFAIWPYSERHAILDEAGKGAVFHLPLSEEHRHFLSRAAKVALVGPGDVWVFSGGQPHTALVVGDGLNISAYESFVPAHPDAMGLLVRSNTKEAHWRKCWMDDEDLDELYEDVVDTFQRSFRDEQVDPRLRAVLQECARVMREQGDSYCKKLWEEEEQRIRQNGKRVDGGAGIVDRGSRSPTRSSSASSYSSGSREPDQKRPRKGSPYAAGANVRPDGDGAGENVGSAWAL